MKVSTIILLSLLPISLICQDSLLISNQFKNEINWTSNFIFESNGLNKERKNCFIMYFLLQIAQQVRISIIFIHGWKNKS